MLFLVILLEMDMMNQENLSIMQKFRLAFQIADDLLDLKGSKEKNRKTCRQRFN